MPVVDGQTVLAELRKDSNLQTIPVVVMTSSDRDEDVARAYALGANCYVRKPFSLDEFKRVVKTIESFWFGVVTRPPRS